jgi:hypothetical protein
MKLADILGRKEKGYSKDKINKLATHNKNKNITIYVEV